MQMFLKPEWRIGLSKLMGKLTEFNSEVWNMKKARHLSLKDSISIPIPKNLKRFRKDFAAMHKIV